MTAPALVHRLQQIGVVLSLEGDRIIADGPDSVLTDETIDAIRQLKPQICHLLQSQQASDRDPYQHSERSDPWHCAWCGTAETSGARVVPYGTDPVGHTWLHPGCWDAWYQERHRKAASALMGAGISEVSR